MKLILASIFRDVESKFPIIKKSFELFLKNMSNEEDKFKFIIYENNSKDKTVDLFQKLERDYPDNVVLVSETLEFERSLTSSHLVVRDPEGTPTKLLATEWNGQPCAAEIRTIARNKLMDIIDSEEYNDYQHVIMYEAPQQMEPLPIQKIIDVIYQDPFLDAVGGIPKMLVDHKNVSPVQIEREKNKFIHSYRDENFAYGPEHIGEYFWSPEYMMKPIRNLFEKSKEQEHVECSSFGGGISVFQKDSIRGARYSAHPTPELSKFYLEHQIERAGPLGKLSADYNRNYLTKLAPDSGGSRTLSYLHRTANRGNGADKGKNDALAKRLKMPPHNINGVNFFNNTGYDYPIVSEHIAFFQSMQSREKCYVDTNFFY